MDDNKRRKILQDRWTELAMTELMDDLTSPHHGIMLYYAARHTELDAMIYSEAENITRWSAATTPAQRICVLQGLDKRARGHAGVWK